MKDVTETRQSLKRLLERVVMQQPKSEFLWIVCWKYKDESWKGHGSPMPKKMAEIVVKKANEDWPEMHHWIIGA